MSETGISVSNRPRKQRPLSPHLQAYKPQLTSILSISHRASGIFLTLGLVLFTWWIVALAAGEDAFEPVQFVFRSILGTVLLIGWTFALFFHLGAGIRHLFWDMGKGFSIEATYRSGYAVVAFAILATVLVWMADLYWLVPHRPMVGSL
jgi:succinate dehydrogenase / fumarate reductase cytochrome b subunit